MSEIADAIHEAHDFLVRLRTVNPRIEWCKTHGEPRAACWLEGECCRRNTDDCVVVEAIVIPAE